MEDYKRITAAWLEDKIKQHYGSEYGYLKRFIEDDRHCFKYSTTSKHIKNKDPIPYQKKHHYYLFFWCIEKGII